MENFFLNCNLRLLKLEFHNQPKANTSILLKVSEGANTSLLSNTSLLLKVSEGAVFVSNGNARMHKFHNQFMHQIHHFY